MPFASAHCAIGALTCGIVIDTRVTYGDLVVIDDVAALEMTIGTFASVTTGATAIALGVSPKPARNCTLSRVISSCAKRFATSGAGPLVSRVISSIFLPATVSPCSFMYAFMPASICAP